MKRILSSDGGGIKGAFPASFLASLEDTLEHNYKHKVVEVALSTAAAPSYFPAHRLSSGTPLVDGGVWANNPVGVAAVEAIGVLGWPADELRILSIGCTSAPLNVKAGPWGW